MRINTGLNKYKIHFQHSHDQIQTCHDMKLVKEVRQQRIFQHMTEE